MSITLTKITTEIDHKRKLTTTAIFIIFRTTTKLTRKSFGTVIIENWNSENLKKTKMSLTEVSRSHIEMHKAQFTSAGILSGRDVGRIIASRLVSSRRVDRP